MFGAAPLVDPDDAAHATRPVHFDLPRDRATGYNTDRRVLAMVLDLYGGGLAAKRHMTIRSRLRIRASSRSAVHGARPQPRSVVLVYHRVADGRAKRFP